MCILEDLGRDPRPSHQTKVYPGDPGFPDGRLEGTDRLPFPWIDGFDGCLETRSRSLAIGS